MDSGSVSGFSVGSGSGGGSYSSSNSRSISMNRLPRNGDIGSRRDEQTLTSRPEEPKLNMREFRSAITTVEYPDINFESRACARENESYIQHMGSSDTQDFLTFARSKLVQMMYIHLELDADELWAEFKAYCLAYSICNQTWLTQHEQFSFRKMPAQSVTSRTKTQALKLRDHINEHRRNLIKTWLCTWKYRDRSQIRNALWHFYSDNVKADCKLFPAFISCKDDEMQRSYDIYDPCLRWDYPIGKEGIVLGMKGFDGETRQIQGWTRSDEHVGFIGHPNYFIAPDIVLKWWMRTVYESLSLVEGIIRVSHIVFDLPLMLDRFDIERLQNQAHNLTRTAPHDLAHLSTLLWELKKLYSNSTVRPTLDHATAEQLRDQLEKLGYCVQFLRDFRDRAEFHLFLGCLGGLGAKDSFFFRLLIAWKDEGFDLGGSKIRRTLQIREPSDFESFFSWTTVGYYAKIGFMTLHNSGSDKLKDASTDSKKLLDIVNTAPGPTPKEIEAFQQTLWNQAFLWSAPSEESGGQPAQQAFCTEQESHERWWSICYLFFDLIEYKSEREEAYIDHTAHSLFPSQEADESTETAEVVVVPVDHNPSLREARRKMGRGMPPPTDRGTVLPMASTPSEQDHSSQIQSDSDEDGSESNRLGDNINPYGVPVRPRSLLVSNQAPEPEGESGQDTQRTQQEEENGERQGEDQNGDLNFERRGRRGGRGRKGGAGLVTGRSTKRGRQ